MSTTLLLVDCQIDFHPGGSLEIPTANDDAERIAAMIRQNAAHIDRVVATMDTHLKLHIAHPSFWCKPDDPDARPEAFSIVSAQDLKDQLWVPRSNLQLPCNVLDELLDPNVFEGRQHVLDQNTGELDLATYCIEYATRLEQNGQFKIIIWPEHCLLGSPGHGLVPLIRDALHEWSEVTGRSIEFVLKGQNVLTEMYSCWKAEVPVTQDTSLNTGLMKSLHQTTNQVDTNGRVLVCGQALSHCVNYTTRDLVEHWPEEHRSRITLLTDCSSSVPGFEAAAEQFVQDMKAKGVQLHSSANAFLAKEKASNGDSQ